MNDYVYVVAESDYDHHVILASFSDEAGAERYRAARQELHDVAAEQMRQDIIQAYPDWPHYGVSKSHVYVRKLEVL